MYKISRLLLHHYALFQLAQLFICGNSGYLSKALELANMPHPPGIKLPLHTFSGKLRTFPTVKSKTIVFLLDLT